MENQHELPIKIVVDAWNTTIARTDAVIKELTDAQLEKEVSPGRNTGVYLLGHLAAVHDRMMPLLGFGPQKYTHLDDVFLANPDKSGKPKPSIAELRNCWKEVNESLAANFNKMRPEDWLQKHTSVSDADFANQPHRNRLNVLVSRTNHLAEHYGQLLFLKEKE